MGEQKFIHLATDGLIYITNNDVQSLYPYSWWITQEPSYSLSSEYNARDYLKGTDGYHRVYTSTSQFAAPEGFPWANGDIYIDKKSEYDEAYANYINAPKTTEQKRTAKVNNLFTKMFEIRNSKVIYNITTYASDEMFYQRLLTDNLHFTALSAVPVDYYVNDINNNQVSFTLTNLQQLTQLLQDFYYECWLTFDIHYAAIQALSGVDIDNYDITKGWPTVPYRRV